MSAADVSTEDREQLRLLARGFNERVVAPRAAELDRQQDPADSFSWEIIEEASKVGLRTLTSSRRMAVPGLTRSRPRS